MEMEEGAKVALGSTFIQSDVKLSAQGRHHPSLVPARNLTRAPLRLFGAEASEYLPLISGATRLCARRGQVLGFIGGPLSGRCRDFCLFSS